MNTTLARDIWPLNNDEAITRFRELRRVCEIRALTKRLIPCKRKLGENESTEDIKNNKKKDLLSFAKPLITNAHFSNHQVINLESDDEGEVNNASIGKGGSCHKNFNLMHPKFSGRGKAPVSALMSSQSEPREKQMFIWSTDLHKRYLDAVHALGGPLAATPKKIKELMRVADITEDDIKSHMLKYSPAQFHNTCSMVRTDAIKTGRNIIQSGSQTLHIGESANGQAAAAARRASGGWALVCRVGDLLPSMKEMLVRSGALERPESSSSQMAAASEANGGWKLFSEPYINGPINNNK